MKSIATQTMAPSLDLLDEFGLPGSDGVPDTPMYSTDSNPLFGDSTASDYRDTYVNGDLALAGQLKGAGVLVVEGDLFISGQVQWDGMIVVRGNVTISGGGGGVHLYGSSDIVRQIRWQPIQLNQ